MKNIFLSNTRNQTIILLFIAFALNINTIFHDYALDDEIVMTHNRYVEKGINGIPEILTSDLFSGFEKTDDRLSEGRYRPFASIIFAIEYQFFGANPWISHLINVLLFVLLSALIYKLLSDYIFKDSKYGAFIACLLFIVHPIHVEVIANIKSRDELITFTLLILSLNALIKYINNPSKLMLTAGLICFFLALLTRESAVVFCGTAPLFFYFFLNKSIKKSILITIPLLLVLGIYLSLRYSIVGFKTSIVTDVLNAPFLFATASQAFATKIFILVKYMQILLFPHPLAWEYGYNQIPYIEINSFKFFFSISLLLGLIIYSIFSFKTRSIFSFSIIYFMITISLASNLIMDIGTPFSERLLFQPSLAFCIVLAAINKIIVKRPAAIFKFILPVIVLLFSIKTFSRNNAWKNNESIILTDVKASPNSIRVNMSAASICLNKANTERTQRLKIAYLKKAVQFSKQSLLIYPDNPKSKSDLVTSYCGLFDIYDSIDLWLKEDQLNPSEPETKKLMDLLSEKYYREGNGFSEQHNTAEAIKSYQKSIRLNKNNIEAWYNLGGNYYLKNDTVLSRQAWEKVKQIDPDFPLNKDDFTNEYK